jgi:hypothetical protein
VFYRLLSHRLQQREKLRYARKHCFVGLQLPKQSRFLGVIHLGPRIALSVLCLITPSDLRITNLISRRLTAIEKLAVLSTPE